jgi:hypothetical protein
VPARDLAHQGQPQSRAGAGVAPEAPEGTEHVLALGVRNAGPVVQHRQLGMAVRGADARLDRGRAVALGIVHEVADQAAKQPGSPRTTTGCPSTATSS